MNESTPAEFGQRENEATATTKTGLNSLPPDYYLRNFDRLLQTVVERYGYLLRTDEREFAGTALALPENPRKVLVRLLCRRGPWFRSAELHYPEIDEIPRAITHLIENDLAVDSTSAESDDLIELLRKEEILQLLRKFSVPVPRSIKRDDARDLLLESAEESLLFPELVAITQPVAPLGADYLQLFLFLFFNNFEQDFTDFVLRDLGRAKYEAYPIDCETKLFSNRDEIDFLFGTAELGETAEEAAAEGDLDALIACVEKALAMNPHQGVRQQRRYSRLLNNLGHYLEQRSDYSNSMRCYQFSSLPPARERRCRILAKTDSIDTAAALALAIADSPLDASEERFAASFLRRNAKKSKLAAQWTAAHPPADPIPSATIHLQRQEISVEENALQYAATLGLNGAHLENGLWCSLFGLFCWDVLFTPVPGAFQHEFQSAPFDIPSPDFFKSRSYLFESIFTELEQMTPVRFSDHLLRRFRQKHGIMNRFVAWDAISEEILHAFALRVSSQTVAAILRIMARNPLRFDSGFPDLFLWREKGFECEFWEVKGPGDSIRPEQEFWLREFVARKISAQVLFVKYR